MCRGRTYEHLTRRTQKKRDARGCAEGRWIQRHYAGLHTRHADDVAEREDCEWAQAQYEADNDMLRREEAAQWGASP